jgi:hypothetical protein
VFRNGVVHSGEDLMDALITCALRKVSLRPYETVAETVDETGHPLRVQLGQTELQEQARWKMTDQYQMPTDDRQERRGGDTAGGEKKAHIRQMTGDSKEEGRLRVVKRGASEGIPCMIGLEPCQEVHNNNKHK